MSKIGEIVRGIGAWEAEVEAITLRSEEAAKVIVENAKTQREKRLSETENRCADRREGMVASAETEGSNLAEQIDQSSKKELACLEKGAQSRKAAVVDMVLKEMRAFYGSR